MMFRKNSILFNVCIFYYAILIILCLVLTIVIPIIDFRISLLLILPFVVFIISDQTLFDEFIIINETGICCWISWKQAWSYEWKDIAELKKGRYLSYPAIRVIPYNKYGKPEQYILDNHEFQLGKSAKKAIEKYYNNTGEVT